MARKMGMGPGRSYARLTRAERNSIERMLDRGESCRAMARELGRSPSTVPDEVARHRFVTSPKSMAGAAPLLQRVREARGYGYGCGRKLAVIKGPAAAGRLAPPAP